MSEDNEASHCSIGSACGNSICTTSARCFSCSACSAASRSFGAHAHSAFSASVTPDSAETTTSTRAPSARRDAASSRIVRQRSAVATLVPPNFSTIQGASGGSGAEAESVTEGSQDIPGSKARQFCVTHRETQSAIFGNGRLSRARPHLARVLQGTPMSRRYAVIDVFTANPLSGNPLAVVVDAGGLDAATMQRFAAWTNLSETTFLLPPTQPGADYRVRIFTPRNELPFAGHPSVGSAFVAIESGLVDAGKRKLVQECAAGLLDRKSTRLNSSHPS